VNHPTFLVTGATDGIGKATALALAQKGAQVILHGRNPGKLAVAVDEIRAATGNAALHPVLADFASLAEVAGLGQRVCADFPGLTVLVNNAGLITDHWQLSADGFEMTFAVNCLAPFLLTQVLLDTLRANVPARVVNVASTAMGGGRVDFGNQGLARQFDGWQAYANTKLMNVLFSHHLAGLLAGSGVVSNALCPGLIDTNFFHTNTVFAGGTYERLKPGMRPPAEGALMPLYLATDPAAGAINGAFLVRQGRDGRRIVPLDWDRAAAAALWAQCLAAVDPWLTPAMHGGAAPR
jgi:NAD(P)-dependent dehydrogenase (short-subunit alcohol dehydrogenase family)